VNPPRRETHVPVGPLVAAIGAILLIVSLGLDWYGRFSGFNAFETLDLVLVALALFTIATLIAAVGLLRTSIEPAIALATGALALIIVLSQLINHPPIGIERDVETGLWLGLAGAALMTAGAVLSTARIAIAVEPRERRAASAPAATTGSPGAARVDEAPTVADEPPPRR
jgi:hypothetical protein